MNNQSLKYGPSIWLNVHFWCHINTQFEQMGDGSPSLRNWEINSRFPVPQKWSFPPTPRFLDIYSFFTHLLIYLSLFMLFRSSDHYNCRMQDSKKYADTTSFVVTAVTTSLVVTVLLLQSYCYGQVSCNVTARLVVILQPIWS